MTRNCEEFFRAGSSHLMNRTTYFTSDSNSCLLQQYKQPCHPSFDLGGKTSRPISDLESNNACARCRNNNNNNNTDTLNETPPKVINIDCVILPLQCAARARKLPHRCYTKTRLEKLTQHTRTRRKRLFLRNNKKKYIS